jgi:hypothetical protein
MAKEPDSLLAYARLVIDALEAAQVVYLLGGALATTAWAEPRSTLDVDLVISLPPEQIVPLSNELAQRGILLPPDLILDQLVESREDVALVAYHREASFKAEFFLLRPGDELRAAALGRRVWVEMEPPIGHVFVHSPEDLILYKLHYFSLSQQTKHIRDITSLLAARSTRLDYAYLEGWVQRLRLQPVWQAMRAEARARGVNVP